MKVLDNVVLSKKQKRELVSFLRKLKKVLNVSEVYLFGSRVYGRPHAESDLDMIVVSEEFGKRSFVENMILLSMLWDGSFSLEMFPYTPKDLDKFYGRKTVVTEALERSVRIKL